MANQWKLEQHIRKLETKVEHLEWEIRYIEILYCLVLAYTICFKLSVLWLLLGVVSERVLAVVVFIGADWKVLHFITVFNFHFTEITSLYSQGYQQQKICWKGKFSNKGDSLELLNIKGWFDTETSLKYQVEKRIWGTIWKETKYF